MGARSKTGHRGHQGQGNGAEARKETPKSLQIAEQGIKTSGDFRDLMSAIMSDVIAGRLTPNMTNAACNAGGKMLKMVDLEMRYGTSPDRPRRTLRVAFEEPAAMLDPQENDAQ